MSPEANPTDEALSAIATATAGVYVVIAAFREASVIEGTVAPLVAQGLQVVVVDDGSRDPTARAAARAGAITLRHALNRGQGAALQTGIAYALRAGASVIVTFDADGQHPHDAIARLLEPIRAGRADVVLGSRFLQHAAAVPWSRRCLLRLAILFTRLSSGLPVSDAHNGFRALSRRAATTLDLKMDRMAHASELLDHIAAQRLAYTEVPVEIRYTTYSRAKGQRGSAAIRVLWDYLLGRLIP